MSLGHSGAGAPGPRTSRRPKRNASRAVYIVDYTPDLTPEFLAEFGLAPASPQTIADALSPRTTVLQSWCAIFRGAARRLGLLPKPPSALSLYSPASPVAANARATMIHHKGCGCNNLCEPCTIKPSRREIYRAAATELAHGAPCDDPTGKYQHARAGAAACVTVQLTVRALDTTPIGDTFGREFFSGSPQEHAVLNRHLLDYFRGRQRAQETTPYSVPTSQRHLLAPLGMEEPQPDAPVVPHGLHKSIEEAQLRRLGRFLPERAYGLVSVKSAKHGLLPAFGSLQNPVHQAKDASRYPGSAIRAARFHEYATYLLHDVSSEVLPHELVERLDADNPAAHLFVTGMNPIEVLDRAGSFEPSSHEITYDLGSFNYVFVGSESEAYSTSIQTTTSWLQTSAVRASSGRVYQVVLLEEKLGHCAWHIFQGDLAPQDSRTFSTGSFVRLPAVITGTWKDEWLPTKLVANVLSFVDRTPDLSHRNLAAKITQLATATTPRLTSRELWVARYIAAERAPSQSWPHVLRRTLWRSLYAVTFQWHLLSPQPDIYHYLDERRRFREVRPTIGGGWSWTCKTTWRRDAMPNCPRLLHRISAFSAAVFTFLAPKVLIGECISEVVVNLPLWSLLEHVYRWADLQPIRLLLTVSVVAVTAVLPGHVVKVFTRLASHFWRQLWWPGWVPQLFERAVVELCGAPGATFVAALPGRGWAYQAYLWAVGLCAVLPGLVPHVVVPWTAVVTGTWPWLLAWWAVIACENLVTLWSMGNTVCSPSPPSWNYQLADWWDDFVTSDFCEGTPTLAVCLWRFTRVQGWRVRRLLAWARRWATVWCALQGVGGSGFTPLAPLPAAPAAVARIRNVDVAIPPVTLQAPRIPGAAGAGPVAVDPTGMNFTEWLREVEAGYAADTAKQPPLTPGQSCFWDCVSVLGGTPHMWYSWYMSFTGTVADSSDPVVGNVTQADIVRFAHASRIGVNLGGYTQLTVAAADSWPVLNLVLTYQPLSGLYHVENATSPQMDPACGHLAVLLKTIAVRWPAWHQDLVQRFNQTPLDSVPQPTPWLRSVMGGLPLVRTRQDVGDAFLGSLAATQIDPQRPGDYRLDQQVVYAADGPDLFDFNAPVQGQRIAHTPPRTMWQRFTRRDGRLKMSEQEGAKIGATASQTLANRTSHNTRPNVAQWTLLRNDLAGRLHSYRDLALPPVRLSEEQLSYTADVPRAARLVADLRAHPSVLESFANPQVIQALDSIVDWHKAQGTSVTLPVRAYVGVWGCGKTTATIAYLKSLTEAERRQTRIVSHTESLRAKSKLALDFPELRGFNFPTMASLLTEPSTGPVVFDDAGKFWGGMLDLLMLTNPAVTEVVINGDPAQGVSRFPVSGTQSQYDLTPIQCIAPLVTRYATVTHRGFRLLADTFGVHTSNSREGHITHTIGPKEGIPVLTASPRYVGVLANSGREAYTYGDVQGEDFKTDVEIDMTGLEGAVLDRAAYVALTRSSTGCYLHLEAAGSEGAIRKPPTGSDLMNALVYSLRQQGGASLSRPSALVKAAFYRHLHDSMPSLCWFARIGANVPAHAYSLVADFAETHFAVESVPVDSPVAEGVAAADGPVEEYVRETHWHAKEHRELPGRGGATDQFKELAFVNPHVHHRRDTATYFLSVQRRLKTASQRANARRMARCPRSDMCDEYDRLMPRPPQWSALAHAEYCDRAHGEYSRTRTEAAVLSKLASHDPLRSGSDITISLKGQVIKKDEKRHQVHAIPGQLIHEYDIRQTLSDAPYALFLEDEIISAFPDNFIFYRRMNPEQFIRAYQARWRVDNGVHTSDVTRWDVGCDAGVLNFDVHVMHRSGFPRDYIEQYVERRLSSRSQHGPMATMQNSGDRYTWALNSVRRAVVTSLVNGVTPEDTVVINGDDGAIDRFADVRQLPDSAWEFKSHNGMRGEFSGFELGGPTPTYSAEGILYRTMVLESRDPTAQGKWVNYMALLAHADLCSPEAVDVARSAQRHMDPALFGQYLPAPLAPLLQQPV